MSEAAEIQDREQARLPVKMRDVTAVYSSAGHRIVALNNLKLSLKAGEVLGLVGPNGSGKTTLLRLATGILKPVAGTVEVCGRSVARLGQREIARLIAVVPQAPVLPDAFTTLDCVLMGRTPHLRLLQGEGPEDIEAARRAMTATDTWRLADRRLGELSGGERQRVVLARALAQETPILLLDEPTAHLDIGHQATILQLIRSLCRRESKSAIAVVHDLTIAAQYCDRLVLLGRGELQAEGTPETVLSPPVLERVYGTPVEVFAHPRTGRPVVAPGGGEA